MKIQQQIHAQRSMSKSAYLPYIAFITVIILCVLSIFSPPIALLSGIVMVNVFGNPFAKHNHKAIHYLLQFSVVGLGFGMNVNSAISAGKEGLMLTVFSIFSILIVGYFIGKLFRIDKKTSYLISSGTAICGGSAIAAIAPVIKSDEKQTSVALGVIFILNAVALFVFPVLGHEFNMTQKEFGMWCAIAIHDTSSVVGAASKFGTEALEIATTVKLARALWIIPISLLTAFLFKNKQSKIKIPYFIGLFILAMLLNTYLPSISVAGGYLVALANIGLTITLFLIGATLNIKTLKEVGVLPFIQGCILWIFIAAMSLGVIMFLG